MLPRERLPAIYTVLAPIPRIPDRDHIEPQADRQQEFVI